MFMGEDAEIIKTQCGMWEAMVETQIEGSMDGDTLILNKQSLIYFFPNSVMCIITRPLGNLGTLKQNNQGLQDLDCGGFILTQSYNQIC
jgi:hypothetical protein